jgi:16S rRNA (adenine(1408)-N(1))-methyltransferase
VAREARANHQSAFLVEGAERLPRDMARVADEVTVYFPWGSLLRGVLDGSSSVVGPIACLIEEGAKLRVLLSAVGRDGVGEITPSVIASRCPMYTEHGLHLVEAEWAADATVAESRSAWAKRLAVGRARRAVSARYRRDAT